MPKLKDTSSFTVTVRASKEGYKTQTTTQTVKVNKANGSLTLSSTSGTLEYPNSTTFKVSGNTGTLSASSSNTSVATVSISGNTVTINSIGVGSATITVTSAETSNYNAKSATYIATVKYQTFTGNSGVGYYADVDGDGTVDGIIFADFKKGASSNSWGGYGYSITKVSSTKNYYISQVNYEGPFGTKNVLSATGSGNNRFDVMKLSDYNNGAKYEHEKAVITSGVWHTPSIGEWAEFAAGLGIGAYNYSKYGLRNEYWSRSTNRHDDGRKHAYYINFNPGTIECDSYTYTRPVRLVRTF